MSLQPVRRCEECGYETTAKTDICLSCGERMRRRVKGGIRGLLRSLILIAIAITYFCPRLRFSDYHWRCDAVADSEHVLKVKEGTVAWNRWREEEPDILPGSRLG